MTQSKVDATRSGRICGQHQVRGCFVERVPSALAQSITHSTCFLNHVKIPEEDAQATEPKHGLLNLLKEGIGGTLVARIPVQSYHEHVFVLTAVLDFYETRGHSMGIGKTL